MSCPAIPGDQAFFGTFRTRSRNGGGSYLVEIRSLKELQNSCTCPDYRVNGLGTCKHIEAVLSRLRHRRVRLFERASVEGSPRTEIYLSGEEDSGRKIVRASWSDKTTQPTRDLLSPYFSTDGTLLASPEIGIAAVRKKLELAPADVRQVHKPSLAGDLGESIAAAVPISEEKGPFDPPVLSSLLASLEIDKSETSTISEFSHPSKDEKPVSMEVSLQLLPTTRRLPGSDQDG